MVLEEENNSASISLGALVASGFSQGAERKLSQCLGTFVNAKESR